MITKTPGSLKAGDVTPHYTVLEDAEPGTIDGSTCVVAKIQWNDGGLDLRVWDNLNAEVDVLRTLSKSELRELVSD